MRTLIATLALLCLAAAPGERPPSEALHDVVRGRLEHLEWKPDEVEAALRPLLDGVRTTGLTADEEVALGVAYFFTFDGRAAKPLLEKHAARGDRLGRVATQALQQMAFWRRCSCARATGSSRWISAASSASPPPTTT